jgi:hypothetical protein
VALTPPPIDKVKNTNKQIFTSAPRTYCHGMLITQIASLHVCRIPWDSVFAPSDSKKSSHPLLASQQNRWAGNEFTFMPDIFLTKEIILR